MINNKIQFAVVREDPHIEAELITRFKLKRAVLIGSGGCTAFSLRAIFPKLDIKLIEPNPAQIKLIEKKISIISKNELAEVRKLIGTGERNPLIESGNFESLFKLLRNTLFEFVIAEKAVVRFFEDNEKIDWPAVFKNPYWTVAFDLFFSNSLLLAMFGPDAIQYAKKNSYPGYFRALLEAGLQRQDARNNYFLQHIFLGRYLSSDKHLPEYPLMDTQNQPTIDTSKPATGSSV